MKQKFISIFILILLSSCSPIAPAPTATALAVSINTPLPTEPPTSAPTQTPVPTQNPALEYQKIEAKYIVTLSPEQKALYEQYNSEDRTPEGLTRRFLDGDLSTYLAYVDMNKDSKDFGEVTFIWNPEQQKPNPALLIGNDVLFINESSASKIGYNPDVDKAQAEATLVKYFDYVRANTIALSKGVNLPNTLDEALADPQAIKFLADGAQVNLRALKSENYVPHTYNVPFQLFNISETTGIVFKSVPKTNENMFFLSKDKETYAGWSVNQTANGPLIMESFSSNGGGISQGMDTQMILSSRIYRIVNRIFFRVSNDDNPDSITNQIIFTNSDWSTQPLIIYTK